MGAYVFLLYHTNTEVRGRPSVCYNTSMDDNAGVGGNCIYVNPVHCASQRPGVGFVLSELGT